MNSGSPENLSSSHREEGDARELKDRLDKDQPESQRGQRAEFNRATGEVMGAGSGAGGDNPGEDYDSDPKGGGGAFPMGAPRAFEDAEHGPRDRHEGMPH